MPTYLELLTQYPRLPAPVYGAGAPMPSFVEPLLPTPDFLAMGATPLTSGPQTLFSPPTFDSPSLSSLGTPPGRLQKQQAKAQQAGQKQSGQQPGQAQAPQQYAAQPAAGGGTIEDAIDQLSEGDANLALAMKLAVYLESGGDANAVGDNGESHGYYQIYQKAHGRNITPEQSRDAYAATRYMLPQFKAAMARVDPNLWRTNPMQAAALTAFYAERPAVMYPTARVQQAWGRASAPRQPAQAAVAPAQPGATAPTGGALQAAMTRIGGKYVWGGTGEQGGFDCSGLVQWSFRQAGVTLPRTAQQQYEATARVASDQLQPGDLVFFADPRQGKGVTHVGIYAGNGRMVSASSESRPIELADMNAPYWRQHFIGGGRAAR